MTTILDCGHVAVSLSADRTYGTCAECERPNIVAYHRVAHEALQLQGEAAVALAKKEAEIERLYNEMSAFPDYQGWRFSYEYPGYFCYSRASNDSDNDFRIYLVFFTPDWERDGTLDVQVQTDDGHDLKGYGGVLPFPREGRTGAKMFEEVRPTLDKILASPPKLPPSAAEVEALAEEALDAACKLIQDRLGVSSGDLAAESFSDGKVERSLVLYIIAELDAKRAHVTR